MGICFCGKIGSNMHYEIIIVRGQFFIILVSVMEEWGV